jgi:hypothetical protein
MYRATVERLRRTVEKHRTPSGRASQRAFAEAYGYDRENLQSVLAGKQEMSVSLLLRLSATLSGKDAPQLPAGVERWSARTWLEMNQNPVYQAMFDICFAD